jgi:diaminobutyrate-2-oxoglutarate transaminase
MLETYWSDSNLEKDTELRGNMVHATLEGLAEQYGKGAFTVRGNGLLRGLDVGDTELATNISKAAFDRHLIVETCGAGDTTVKMLPPIVIDEDELSDGLARLSDAVAQATSIR